MKNRFLYILSVFIISIFFISNSYSSEQFSFDVTNIEILENGNVFKGSNKGIIKTNDGLIIIADSFEYNKSLNILKANGNVKIEDTLQNYYLFSESINYEKNKEIIRSNGNSKALYDGSREIKADNFEYFKMLNILNANGNVEIEDRNQDIKIYAQDISYEIDKGKIYTKGSTKSDIQSKYFFQSKNVEFLLEKNEINSKEKTIIKDKNKNQLLNLSSFLYLIKEELIKGNNITFVSNFGLPESDKAYFSNAIIDLKNQNFISKDPNIDLNNNAFGNPENNPRLKGVSAKKNDNLISIKKGIFTSCNSNKKCPPWSLQADEIKHDSNKKQLIYENAILKIYDLPILYFPKFFHPDPSVSRQTGFLKPQLSNSNILGNSFTLPYYYVSTINKDFTITPTLFDSNTQMLQTEFRLVEKNSSLIADFGLTRGYKSKFLNKKKNINHFFGEYNKNLELENFNSSSLALSIEKISSDTYLKVFENNIVNDKLKPENSDKLKNEIEVNLRHNNFDFNFGIQAFEDLQKKNSDRYQYVFPYYNYSSTLSDNFFNGFLSFNSNGSNDLKNTNNLRSRVINDLSFRSYNFITNKGIKNNINFNLRNLNSVGKNDNEYKSSPQLELMGDIEFQSNLPLIKKTQKYNNFLTPKLSLRYSPNNMKSYTDSERFINTDNIFSNNRIGADDTFEAGESLTLGLNYKKEKIEDINNYFEMKLATVFRKNEENFLPKTTTLNKKNSNIFGSISNNLNENLILDYNFAINNDYNTFEYNNLSAAFNINNFFTKFSFIEESGEMGSSNSLENIFEYKVDKNNFISFKTRRNRKINLTEYYDLVYEYKIDCLTAGIKYNKTYYEDRDLKPSENIYFTISLFPLTSFEQKVSQ